MHVISGVLNIFTDDVARNPTPLKPCEGQTRLGSFYSASASRSIEVLSSQSAQAVSAAVVKLTHLASSQVLSVAAGGVELSKSNQSIRP